MAGDACRGVEARIRETMQAGNRDIDSFVRQRNGEPWSIVLFDTMPGGTGYLSKLVRDGGAGLKAVAASACSRLESCSCDSSCHRCLREFLNQRVHDRLDRFEVMALFAACEGEATESLDPENEQLESFLEIEFFKRLKDAGLPTPTLQVVRRLDDGQGHTRRRRLQRPEHQDLPRRARVPRELAREDRA